MDEIKDWFMTFGRIIENPFPTTFLVEAKKAKGKFAGAIAWIAFVAVFAEANVLILIERFSVSRILKALLFAPIVFIFSVFCIHMFYQKFFGRKKYYYEELLYLIVGIFVPFMLASILASNIPIIGVVVSLMILAYAVILTVIAVKAITKLKIWQSVIVVFSGLVVAAIGYFVIPILIFS